MPAHAPSPQPACRSTRDGSATAQPLAIATASQAPSPTAPARPTRASLRPRIVGLVDGTPRSARPVATRKPATVTPSIAAAAVNSDGTTNRKAHASRTAPADSPACSQRAVASGLARLAPATTGRIWISAPSMTCIMKPTVIRCVAASSPGTQREASSDGPATASSRPAASANSGAVRKKRSGAAKGGALSKESSACMRLPAQRQIRISKVPSATSSVSCE